MNTQLLQAAKYLVCVDSRDESRVALRLACMKASARSSKVGLLHVVPPADFQTLGAIAERMREERHREGKEMLEALAKEAVEHFHIQPILHLREGSAGDEILQSVRDDADISMLVLGTAHHTSGRGKLAAWLAGQLGSKLLVPLLMVPGNLTDQQLQTLI